MNFLDIVDATYYNAGGNVELSENSNQVISLNKKPHFINEVWWLIGGGARI